MEGADYNQQVQDLINNNKVMCFSKDYCPFAKQAKAIFTQAGLTESDGVYKIIEMDLVANGNDIHAALKVYSKQNTVPNTYINGKHLGGCDDTKAALANGNLKKMLDEAGVAHKLK